MLHSSICCVYAGPQHQLNRDAVKWLRLLRKSDKFLGKILFILNTLANLVATHTHTDLCSYSSSKQRSLLSATPASYLLSANSAVLCSTHGFVIPKSSEYISPPTTQRLECAILHKASYRCAVLRAGIHGTHTHARMKSPLLRSQLSPEAHARGDPIKFLWVVTTRLSRQGPSFSFPISPPPAWREEGLIQLPVGLGGQTGDGKSERWHTRNQRTQMDWNGWI